LIELFESWISKHGKIYETIEEKLLRFEVFKDNLKHIDDRNKIVSNYWLGLNEFADLSHQEFKNKYLGLKVDLSQRRESSNEEEFTYRDVDLPKSVDWKKKGAVTAVKNQCQCGSCWAFSTVAAVEGINQIVTGNLTSLSEQELIDCDTTYNNGCNGGLMDYAFSFIVQNGGLHKEEDYPYLHYGRKHLRNEKETQVVTINGYHDVPQNNEQSLLKALANQPLSVAIEASSRDFQFYSGADFNSFHLNFSALRTATAPVLRLCVPLLNGGGLCTCRHSDAQVGLSVEFRFSDANNTYLENEVEVCIYSPQRWAKVLDGINGHQVAAGMWLMSLDEQ
ncbi:xylem cysteine proteinase 1-like protein, partial [Trifolium pratense]